MNQLNLFAQTYEKGSNEWTLGRAVREDRPGMYRVVSPRKPETPRYGTVVPIRRYHTPMIPRPAH